MKKKLVIGFGILVGLFVLAALTIPFLVDVDQFRPKIVKLVNESINGEFQLGKLQLSLWGGVKVRIESLTLSAKGEQKPLLATHSAYLDIPVTSLLMMSPEVIVVIDKPQIHINKFKDGTMDISRLMKPSTSEKAAPSPDTGAGSLPAIAVNASLGLKVREGAFSLNDQASGSQYQIDGLEIEINNVGFKETMQVEVHMPLKGSSASLKMDGEVELHGKIKPELADGTFSGANGQIEVDATELGFSMNQGMIEKTNKVQAQVKVDFSATPQEFRLKNLEVLFADLRAQVTGVVTLQPQMSLDLKVQSSKIDFSSFEKMVPMLKEYQLAGTGALALTAKGSASQPQVQGEFKIAGGKLAYPQKLKGPIAYDLDSTFTEKTLDVARLSGTGPGTHFNLKMNVRNFAAPVVNLALTSSEIDVDKLMKSELDPSSNKKSARFSFQWIETAEAASRHAGKAKTQHKADSSKNTAASAAEASAPVAVAGANPFLGLAKNPILAQATVAATANIAKLIAKNSVISDIAVKLNLKNLLLNIESASLKAFDGKVNAKFEANLKTAGLNFKTSGTLQGLQLKNAITQYVPSFQNTLEGTGNANWMLSGVAFPAANALQNLNGHISLNAEKGQLHTIDIQKSISGALDKVPLLKGKTIPGLDQSFEHMKADIQFNNGVIDANPLEMIGNEKGLNIKGRSRILASNMTQDTFVDVFDPHMLLPKEISNGKDAALSLHVTGAVTAPQTDYGYTVERLAKVVVKNQGKELINKGLQGLMGGATGKGGGDATKDAVKGVLKGLGF